MKRKNRQHWQKQKLRLKDNHTWNAPDGYKIVVIDRGAASFNVPRDWVIAKFDPLEMYDKPQPNDDSRLMVTLFNLPPGVDWSGLPLDKMLEGSTQRSEMEILERSEIVRQERPDLELVWVQHRFLDPVEKRDAFSRIATVRGSNVQLVITLDFWPEHAEKLQAMWAELLRSIILERRIEDPTKGEINH